MDPVTAACLMITEALKIIGKVIDITPPEMHAKNFERLDRLVDHAEKLLALPK